MRAEPSAFDADANLAAVIEVIERGRGEPLSDADVAEAAALADDHLDHLGFLGAPARPRDLATLQKALDRVILEGEQEGRGVIGYLLEWYGGIWPYMAIAWAQRGQQTPRRRR